MKKEMLTLSLVLLLVISVCGCVEETPPVKEPNVLYVGGKCADFTVIQDAIDNALDGYSIFVSEGTYNESLVIDKSIRLIGADKNKSIIISNVKIYGPKDIIFITADNCTVAGFKIINTANLSGSSDIVGIKVESYGNNISNNTILNFKKGIRLYRNKNNNYIYKNNIFYNTHGIYSEYSEHNNISNNYISYNSEYGIYLGSGSSENVIYCNHFSDNVLGLRVKGSFHNEVFGNTFINNEQGLYFCCGANKNTAFYNIFKDNTEWHAKDKQDTQWSKDSVGNFWDDYMEKYPDAIAIDGVWDIPYDVYGERNKDMYPLVQAPET